MSRMCTANQDSTGSFARRLRRTARGAEADAPRTLRDAHLRAAPLTHPRRGKGIPRAPAARGLVVAAALGVLQAADEIAQEHAVEAQLAGSGHLLQQRRAHLQHRHAAGGTNGRRSLGSGHIARLAEAIASLQPTDGLAVALDCAAPGDEDVEAIVHLAFLDDLLALDVVLPAARAQHFPDFRVRELVEELQSSQD